MCMFVVCLDKAELFNPCGKIQPSKPSQDFASLYNEQTGLWITELKSAVNFVM